MEEVRFLKNLYRERRLLRKEILRNKRLKPKVVREKISIRRGLNRSKAGSSNTNSLNDEDAIQYEDSNFSIFRPSEIQDYMDIGDMATCCVDCGALIWVNFLVGLWQVCTQ
ncbi:hypothetical protein P8452_26876 [Trifolium repens]|nr:hypothetical protein P8452_26876 [Trifolium repens]